MAQKEVICEGCGITWIPRVENPKECPACKRKIFNIYKPK
jgi:rubrerythrin